MQKCLVLNLYHPTRIERKRLKKTYQTFLQKVQEAFPKVSSARSRKTLEVIKQYIQDQKNV